MHICHVALALKGGPATVIADWVSGQVALGHRVSIVYSPRRDRLEDLRGSFPLEVTFFPLAAGRDVSIADIPALVRLVSILRRLKPDVVHLHSAKAGGIGRPAVRICGIPAVYSPHGLAYLRQDVSRVTRMMFYAFEWMLAALGDVTVAASATEQDFLRGLPGLKLLIPNGVKVEEIASTPAAPRPEPERLRLLLCGRLSAQKDPARAGRLAAAAPPDWEWLWIGDGELRAGMAAWPRVRVQGWMPRSQVLALMASADIFVHTSKWEGMPIAILEAMTLGKPVVATNVVGNKDLVVDGVTGNLAETDEQFLAALHALAASSARRAEMGQAGRAEVVRHYDQAVLIRDWIGLYERMVFTGRVAL